MLMRRARLDRAKSGDAKACAPGRQPIAIVSDVTFECEFGSGEQTYRDPRLFLRGKAARGCAIETGCDKGLPNLGWARCNGMQAVITHGGLLLGFSPMVFAPERRSRRNGLAI